MILENKRLQLILHPERGSWDLVNNMRDSPSILGAKMRITYRIHGQKCTGLSDWRDAFFSQAGKPDRVHGVCKTMLVITPPDSNGIGIKLSFLLPEEHPLLLWKMDIENSGSKTVRLERLLLLQVHGGSLPVHRSEAKHRSQITNLDSEPAFFSNGWGSWDYSGVYQPEDKFRRTRLGPITTPMRVNAGTPRPNDRGHFASDMFAVIGDRVRRGALLVGFLSQKQHFGSLETWLDRSGTRLQMWANGDHAELHPGASIETDWACVQPLGLDDFEPLAPYLEAVARENESNVDIKSKSYIGWCSWYQFYADLHAEDVQRNIKTIADLCPDLPLNLIQIDDGYEKWVGDWLDIKSTFPKGMASLADEIKDAGFIPGLWLAPFIVDPRSKLARDHPDWLIRGRLNRPANAGYSFWGRFTRGLDLTHPGALEYIREVVRAETHRWGFTYLKLDFLYAAAIPGNHNDPTKTRAQILRTGLESIREAVGQRVALLGCGCPIGSGIGIVDAMRIGPDVDGHWVPNPYGLGMFLKNEPGLPSVRNAIHNTLARSFMHQHWWINDPDCLLLRPDTNLSLEEVHSLATAIAFSGGSLLLSDDLPELPFERLEIARSLLPLIQKRPRVLDWFDTARPSRVRLDLENATGKWHLLARFNWLDEPQKASVSLLDYALDPERTYLAREYWTGQLLRSTDGVICLSNVPAHGVAVLAVREETPKTPHYLGSDMHISQGLEVSKFEVSDKHAELILERPGVANGNVILSLPSDPLDARLNDLPCSWQSENPTNCYSFKVTFRDQGRLNLKF